MLQKINGSFTLLDQIQPTFLQWRHGLILSGLMSLVKFHHRNSSTHSFSDDFRRKSGVSSSDGCVSQRLVAFLNNPGELNIRVSQMSVLSSEKDGESTFEILLRDTKSR